MTVMKHKILRRVFLILLLTAAVSLVFILTYGPDRRSTDTAAAQSDSTGNEKADVKIFMTVSRNGRNFEVLFHLESTYKSSSRTLHTTGTAEAVQDSQKTSVPFESYIVSDGITNTLYLGCGGRWMKTDIDPEKSVSMDLDPEDMMSEELKSILIEPIFHNDNTMQITSFYADTSFLADDGVEDTAVTGSDAVRASETDNETISEYFTESLGIGTDGTVEIPRLKRAAQRSTLGDNWYSFSLRINDKIITLPCSCDDMTAAGLVLDTDDLQPDTVISGYGSILAFFRNTDDGSVTVNIFNPYSKPRALKECLITEVKGDSWTQEAGISVTSAGEVTVGSAGDEAVSLYGQPDKTEEDDSYTVMTWTRNGNFHRSMAISISKETGKVDEIDLCRSE